MKFTPESLIEIYLNGSFTEEAQAEFDALMKADASFAERVTQSIAEKLGPLPAGLEAQIESRLDSKIDGIWQAHQPSPWRNILKTTAKAALVLAAAGGFYGGFQHFKAQNHQALEAGISTGVESSNSHPAVESPSSRLVERKKQSGQTVSLSFKELPAASGSNLSTPSAFGGDSFKPSQAHPSINVNRGAGTELSVGRDDHRSQAAMAGAGRSEEGNSLRVSIEMEKTGKVIITVLDSEGLLVRRLYQGVWNQGTHLLDWDGKDEAGNLVQPGNYTVAVNANGKTMSGTLTIRSER